MLKPFIRSWGMAACPSSLFVPLVRPSHSPQSQLVLLLCVTALREFIYWYRRRRATRGVR